MRAYSLKIGGRIYKTVFAVFACFLIDTIRNAGVPFYAAIAAILCIQRSPKDSFQQAKNRELATIGGGIWGMAYLLFERHVFYLHAELLRYAVLSLLLIPIIQFSLLIRQEKGTFLMCVVFLSITAAHATDISPIRFAVDRMVDTSIGIAVALAVNMLPRRGLCLRQRKANQRD